MRNPLGAARFPPKAQAWFMLPETGLLFVLPAWGVQGRESNLVAGHPSMPPRPQGISHRTGYSLWLILPFRQDL